MTPYDLFAPEWPYLGRAATAAATLASTGALLYSLSPHLGPGCLRFLIALIAVGANCWVSAMFHPEIEVVSVAITALAALWLASFKAIGWALNRGPLTQPLTFAQFISIYIMPITPSAEPSKDAGYQNRFRLKKGEPPRQAMIDAVAKLLLLMSILIIHKKYENLPLIVKEAAYVLGLYAFVSLMMAPLGAAVTWILHLDIAPYFDRPYLSCSLTDYWSRRWNLNAAYTLRFLVYEPICEGRLIKEKQTTARKRVNKEESISQPPLYRRAIAACVTFLVSGAIHELIIYFVRGRFSGSWLTFFTLQGPLVVLESLSRWYTKQNKMLSAMSSQIPHSFSVLFTLSVLLTLGDWYFFPDVLAMGIPQNVVSNLYDLLLAPWLG